MANMTNTTDKNGTASDEHYAGTVTIVAACNVLFIGLLANTVLLTFVVKKLASGTRNDKLFLLNIIAANLLSLLGSLFGQILGKENIIPSAQEYCLYYHAANFISLFNNLTSIVCFVFYSIRKYCKISRQSIVQFLAVFKSYCGQLGSVTGSCSCGNVRFFHNCKRRCQYLS